MLDILVEIDKKYGENIFSFVYDIDDDDLSNNGKKIKENIMRLYYNYCK